MGRALTNLRRQHRKLILGHQAATEVRVKTTADAASSITVGQLFALPCRIIQSYNFTDGSPLFLADYDPADGQPVQ